MITLPQLRKAQGTDRESLVELLTSVELPVEDLPTSLDDFLIVKDGEKVVGSVGLESYGEYALLRSLAVAPRKQGTGLGRMLYEAAVNLASKKGIREVYLITTTAAPFFARQGFSVVDRSLVPVVIQSTQQLSSVCPSSATIMKRRIA